MRVVFMGSAALACPSLGALLDAPECEVVGVVTQPDRPKGRNLVMTPSPVRAFATGHAPSIPVLTPENVNVQAAVQSLRDLQPDLLVIVAYGQILRQAVLSLPPMGVLNLHTSLLPAYRGAAPIQWAIANGEKITGVTTMYVSARMDAGDVIFQEKVAIGDEDTGGTLHDTLAQVGAALLLRTVTAVGAGQAPRVAQEESLATYAPKFSREDGRLDWSRPAEELRNRIRAFNPWPGCFCQVPSTRKWTSADRVETEALKVLRARVADPTAEGAGTLPGTVLDVIREGVGVATGRGILWLLEVQPEGKKPMTMSDYLRGHSLCKGMQL